MSNQRGAQGAPQHASTSTSPEEVLLGRYRVLERRGTGGFGSVCTCWDLRLQRRVAIKRTEDGKKIRIAKKSGEEIK